MSVLYLYIIGTSGDNPIKIGASNAPKSRLLSLQTNHPFKLKVLKQWGTDFAFELERIVHYELRDYRLNGEWFQCSFEVATAKIKEVMDKTNRGKDLRDYAEKKQVIKSIAAQRAGNAYGKKAKARVAAGVKKIKERWRLPSNLWPTKILLEEADVSLNSVKSVLGSRIVAQKNYQAMLKRKDRQAKGIRYKRADNYIDEVPDDHRN